MSWSRNHTGRLARGSPQSTHWGFHSPNSEQSEIDFADYELDFSALYEGLRRANQIPRVFRELAEANLAAELPFPSGEQFAPAAAIPVGAVYQSDDSDNEAGMADARPPKYNGELGKQQDAFFDHSRTHCRRMCLRKDRVLHSFEGYGQLEFMDIDLRDCLGPDALEVLTTFLHDAVLIPPAAGPERVAA